MQSALAVQQSFSIIPVTEGNEFAANMSAWLKSSSQNTANKYGKLWAAYADWCGLHRVVGLPATPDTVAAYLESLAGEYSTATIKLKLTAISTLHKLAEAPVNPALHPRVTMTMKGIARNQGTRQHQAGGLGWAQLRLALAALPDTPKGKRDAALLLVGLDSMARRSELAALQVGDIQQSIDGAGSILIRKSKTDQTGDGAIKYLSATAMQAVADWLAVADIESGPIFRGVDKHGNVANNQLSDMGVYRAIKKAAALAGVDPAMFSGHILRVGAAQDMATANVELPSIMQAGGWKSAAMVARYTERMNANRSGAAKLAAIQGR